MRTAWGYDIEEQTLEPLLSVEQFNTMTGNAYSGNARVEPALKAASQAIRNFCGWHICPSLRCEAYPAGGGKVIKLPASYVSEIVSVHEEGVELGSGQYEWRHEGLLRRCCFRNWSGKWDAVQVVYRAGFDIAAVPDLAETIRAITESVITVSAGVMSESADGVSISYSASASSIAAALTAQQKNALEIYKVVSSHGA